MLPFIRDNARWIGGGFLLTFLSSFGQTFFIALSAGELRAEFGLSHGGFGWLYMLATLASAATLPFLGRIVDVTTVRHTVLVFVPLLALACLGMALVPNVGTLVLVLYGLRLFGQGMMTHIAMTAMGRWYAARRGRAVSLVALGHQAGEMALPLGFVWLLAIGLDWHSVWLGCAVVLVLAGLPAAAQLMAVEREPEGEASTSRGAPRAWTRGEVLRDPAFWVMMTGVLAPAFIGTTVFFHQVYMIELRGWSPVAFASGFTIMGVLTVAAGLGTGVLIDRVGSLRVLPFFTVPLAASCLVLGLVPAPWAIFAFFPLLGLSYGMSQTLFGALWPEVYGTRHLGAVRSTIVAMMVFATAAGPGLTGALIDAGIGLPDQLVAMALYCVVIGIVLALVARRVMRRTGGVAAPAQPA